jgi:hypothetical protein
VVQRFPVQLALACALEVSPREQQAGLAKGLHAGGGRPGGGEAVEQVPQRLLDGGVGVEDHVPGSVVDQSDRQRHLQFATAGLGEHPAAQSGLDEVQFGLAHLALHAQQ